MDSLLQTYASSDEEEDDQPQTNPRISLSSKSSSLFSSLPKPQSSGFSSLPPPKSSSQTLISLPTPKEAKNSNPTSKSSAIFSSLPPPKSSSQTLISLPTPKEHPQQGKNSDPTSKPSALFSSLPAPKTLATPDFHLPPPNSNPKRVVQFRPPVPLPSKDDDDDDDDEDEEEDAEEREKKRQRQLGQDTSVKSFLSSMPVPRNSAGSTLGAAPSLGSGRRSVIETEAPEPTSSGASANGVSNEVGFDANVGNNNQGNWDSGSNAYNQVQAGGDQSYAGYEGVGAYGSSGGYDSYGNYANYESGWYDTSSGAMAPEASGAILPETTGGIESFVNMDGRRRKGKVPTQIVEVKQDELMKNRPREDQSKMTGLAFGPSYQPAPSTKGKPTKLAKRKHQIGSLYFDLKQKEMELAERRSKGLLTKAETQAKYGW